jgi:hypothetical protein
MERRAKIKQQRENYKAYLDEKAKKDAAANQVYQPPNF